MSGLENLGQFRLTVLAGATLACSSFELLWVLIYIHGGGYVFRNPCNWPFEHWINQSLNVAIVSVYYCLDLFGFLAHPSTSDLVCMTLWWYLANH